MNIHLILKEGDEDLIYLRNFLPPKIFWQIYQQCNRSRTHRQTGVFLYRL